MSEGSPSTRLAFHGGIPGAMLPALVFLSGVTALALQGAPDERGFWPILLFALCVSLLPLAHARGAYVFADIIQAVGAVPVDVRALGIDFAATGTYKWLMGERGFGFLYVREEHQGTLLPTTRYGHRQVTNFNRAQLTWEPLPGAAMYESGGISVLLAACVSAGIDYVNALGIDTIRAHARKLTDRLQDELPPLGYKPVTPRGTETPIVAFEVKDSAATEKLLKDGKVAATVIANENRLRLSVSVFNNHEDIDRVVYVLKRGAASTF